MELTAGSLVEPGNLSAAEGGMAAALRASAAVLLWFTVNVFFVYARQWYGATFDSWWVEWFARHGGSGGLVGGGAALMNLSGSPRRAKAYARAGAVIRHMSNMRDPSSGEVLGYAGAIAKAGCLTWMEKALPGLFLRKWVNGSANNCNLNKNEKRIISAAVGHPRGFQGVSEAPRDRIVSAPASRKQRRRKKSAGPSVSKRRRASANEAEARAPALVVAPPEVLTKQREPERQQREPERQQREPERQQRELERQQREPKRPKAPPCSYEDAPRGMPSLNPFHWLSIAVSKAAGACALGALRGRATAGALPAAALLPPVYPKAGRFEVRAGTDTIAVVVTSPVSTLEGYYAAVENVTGATLAAGRHMVQVPVAYGCELYDYLLYIAGRGDVAAAPTSTPAAVVLVVPLGAEKKWAQRVFRAVEKAAEADADAALAGFTWITGRTLVASVPLGCAEVGGIGHDDLVAWLSPKAAGVGVELPEGDAARALARLAEAAAPPADPGVPSVVPTHNPDKVKFDVGREEELESIITMRGGNAAARAAARLELVARRFVRFAPFFRPKDSTRGTVGHFPQDGVRPSPGGGEDSKARHWKRGAVERYHTVGPGYTRRMAGKQAYFERVKAFQSAWRACGACLLGALMAYLSHEVGGALVAFLTAMALQPGLSEVALHPGIAFQQMQASYNAKVNVHIDRNDLFGALIVWLFFSRGAPNGDATSTPAAEEGSAPKRGGVFVLYDLGFCFEIGHLSCVWLRSDRFWHGTVRDARLTPRDMLFGVSLANTKPVTDGVLRVLHCEPPKGAKGAKGAKGPWLVTWRRRYDADPPVDVCIKKQE